jgi:zinc transporter
MSETAPLVLTFDGKGGNSFLEDISDVQLESASGKQTTFYWVHLPAQDAQTLPIMNALDLDPIVTEALLAEDTRPRLTIHGNGAILIVRAVNVNEAEEPEDMVSLRMWIERNLVVSIWVRASHAVADVLKGIERSQSPTSSADLVSRICLRIADRAEPLVSELNERMFDLESYEAGADDSSVERQRKLIDIRQTATKLRRFLFPQRDALTTLTIEDLSWFKERDRSKVREAAERITRLAEELDALGDRAIILHDQILAERSDRMNRTMLILTVVTAVFLPLSLITGLLGINVGGIPGANSENAFWIVTSALIVLGLLLWFLVRMSRLMN